MQNLELSLEQQFELRSFEVQVQTLSREEAQQRLIDLCEQMMLRENLYNQMLRDKWGIESMSAIGGDRS